MRYNECIGDFMFDLAKAMTLAYSEATKKNPRTKRGTPSTIDFVDLKGNDVSMDVTYLGKGMWTQAYKTKDHDVILIVDENRRTGDTSKKMLADWNETLGETAHVPFIQKIGYYKIASGVYKVPLYKTFVTANKEKELSKRHGMLWGRLENIVEKIRDKSRPYPIGMMQTEDYYEWSKKFRKLFIKKLEEESTNLPYHWEESDRFEWQSILGTIIQMLEFSSKYKDSFLIEFSGNNLALDGNNQVILLDIFFDPLKVNRLRGFHV
jgi:hypothetical protein